ncbi:MAG TPA: antitoxin Xre/MbcA/ParS toxin-binding domain-containing protein [Geobacteraceae bacterium]|nr:antitoxin Xre/MbcA/ParS toxin-binding domain-containing protein [Geobacteraceae bacterium]
MGYAELANILGIEEPRDEADLVELTRKGLSADVAQAIADKLGISVNELSQFIHVSSRTLKRHKGEILDTGLSDRLMTVGRVYARAVEVFKTEERATRWLKSRILALGNARPLDLLDTSTGAGMVITILGRIEHGVYS